MAAAEGKDQSTATAYEVRVSTKGAHGPTPDLLIGDGGGNTYCSDGDRGSRKSL